MRNALVGWITKLIMFWNVFVYGGRARSGVGCPGREFVRVVFVMMCVYRLSVDVFENWPNICLLFSGLSEKHHGTKMLACSSS